MLYVPDYKNLSPSQHARQSLGFAANLQKHLKPQRSMHDNDGALASLGFVVFEATFEATGNLPFVVRDLCNRSFWNTLSSALRCLTPLPQALLSEEYAGNDHYLTLNSSLQ